MGLVLRVFLEYFRAQKMLKFAKVKQAYVNFVELRDKEDAIARGHSQDNRNKSFANLDSKTDLN